MMRIDVLTLFPGIFSGYLSESIPRIAIDKGAVNVYLHNIRDWSRDKHAKTDDRPFGGGPGMVMTCQPLDDAVSAVRDMDQPQGELIFLTPEGERLTQSLAHELAARPRLLLVCGRYEGFDDRIFSLLQPRRISVGDYVLSGGEIAAITLMDAVIRLQPGVLGSSDSAAQDSFEGPALDYPHYTQPPVYRGLAVPLVLRSGNHAQIDAWRSQQADDRTRSMRPDLIEGNASLS